MGPNHVAERMISSGMCNVVGNFSFFLVEQSTVLLAAIVAKPTRLFAFGHNIFWLLIGANII